MNTEKLLQNIFNLDHNTIKVLFSSFKKKGSFMDKKQIEVLKSTIENVIPDGDSRATIAPRTFILTLIFSFFGEGDFLLH